MDTTNVCEDKASDFNRLILTSSSQCKLGIPPCYTVVRAIKPFQLIAYHLSRYVYDILVHSLTSKMPCMYRMVLSQLIQALQFQTSYIGTHIFQL